MTNDLLEARYGRKRRARGDRRLVMVLGSVLAVALVGFIVWASFGRPATATGSVTQAVATNGHQMTVSFSVDNPTGKALLCQVSALNDHESSVGSRQVPVAADQASVDNLTIVTVQPAGSAVVDSCWTR